MLFVWSWNAGCIFCCTLCQTAMAFIVVSCDFEYWKSSKYISASVNCGLRNAITGLVSSTLMPTVWCSPSCALGPLQPLIFVEHTPYNVFTNFIKNGSSSHRLWWMLKAYGISRQYSKLMGKEKKNSLWLTIETMCVYEVLEAQIQSGRVFRKVSFHNCPVFMLILRYAFSATLVHMILF